MVAHNRRLDYITLEIEDTQYECQITSWTLNPPDSTVGDLVYTFCPDGAFREVTDPGDWSLELTWVTDWRTGGLNRLLLANQGQAIDFTLVNHPGVTGETVTFAGQLYAQAPPMGGDARTTETSTVTLTGVGNFPTPTYA
jgi:hypothetical protein